MLEIIELMQSSDVLSGEGREVALALCTTLVRSLSNSYPDLVPKECQKIENKV